MMNNDKYKVLEKMLEENFGEHDGLLESIVIGFIQKSKEHESAKEKKFRARLLTNETVDEWEKIKNLKKNNLLLQLPCKPGDTLYCIIDIYQNGDYCGSEIQKGIVDSLQYTKNTESENNDFRIGILIPEMTDEPAYFSSMKDMNVNIFCTLEDAEAAKKRKERTHDHNH